MPLYQLLICDLWPSPLRRFRCMGHIPQLRLFRETVFQDSLGYFASCRPAWGLEFKTGTFDTWDLGCRSGLLSHRRLGRLCYVEPKSPLQWKSWSPPLLGTFVASAGRLRHEAPLSPLSPQLADSATLDLGRLSWLSPLRLSFKQVLPKGTYLQCFQTGITLGHVPALTTLW